VVGRGADGGEDLSAFIYQNGERAGAGQSQPSASQVEIRLLIEVFARNNLRDRGGIAKVELGAVLQNNLNGVLYSEHSECVFENFNLFGVSADDGDCGVFNSFRKEFCLFGKVALSGIR
jgi:hypothetical protein